jgi:hypothetical protein
VRAEDDRRKFYSDLVQYAVWCMTNIHRPSGTPVVPIQDYDPVLMMDALRKETKKTPVQSRAEMSKEAKAELIRKMDKEAYIEYHKKKNNK